MSASLSNVTLNDHTGFTDRLMEYTLDEPKAQMIVDSMPANLKYALEYGTSGLKRHYAIPGSPRCVQCHMGSPTHDFALGFLPLQVARRAEGTGGSYEPTGPDELTQLQRFIDYGIITGMASPADVVLLEQSQGTRQPRNAYELDAQAYLLGNCAHCHNPRGFPSVKSPALKDVLDFLPSESGGIFQFPLDRFSPLRSRGIDQNVPIPYITPSLREYPVASSPTPNWTPKWFQCDASGDISAQLLCGGRTSGNAHLSAPWRSLIYRNVDTPFMYADDLAIFPHMPMNSAGYDCRITRIMGDWMVSVPAVRKSPKTDEDAVPPSAAVDYSPQPYVEVAATDLAYAAAKADADARLEEYHASSRYNFCPDTSDIVDPAVIQAGGGYPLVPGTDAVPDPAHPGQIIQPDVGVPNRAHWVVTDLTDPLGDWSPRRTKWDDVLVKDVVDMTDLPPSPDVREQELRARQIVLDEIQGATLSKEFRDDFVLKEVPFGLWQQKPECDLSSVPKVSDFPKESRPDWMVSAAPSETAPVYMQAPGASVFTNICINCHGPLADSKGLLADALANMTGGTGRVANFRGGLFGPPDSPGSNRARVFGPFATDLSHPPVVTPDDWAARYMAWMALGGTLIHVPDALLNIVATTPVVGVRRSQHLAATPSPNMLKLAQALCGQVLVPSDIGAWPKVDDRGFFNKGRFNWSEQTGLIDANGDAEMWQRLCSWGNRVVVRVPYVPDWSAVDQSAPTINPPLSLYYGDGGAYPPSAPVLDHRRRVTNGIQPDNVFPMCFRKPSDAKNLALSDAYLAAHPVGGPGGAIVPYCPDSLFQDPKSLLEAPLDESTGTYQLIGMARWATRGAINAGFAVFLYLDELVRGHVVPAPLFNHCEDLKKP
jgi:mono/diheme cytochrome c family protein